MSSEEYFLNVSVGDPTKQSDSFGVAHITYRITTKTNKPSFGFKECNVTRRYTDFAWLAAELAQQYPGGIIPALPEKQAVGRFSPEFVESRRRALEKFLKRVSLHIELTDATVLKVFLSADDAQLAAAKEASKANRGRITEIAMGWFEGVISGSNTRAELEKSAADLKIDEMNQYITALEKQLQNVTRHSSALCKRSRESAHAVFEFAQSLTWLGQAEGEALGEALCRVGTSLDALSSEATKHAEAEVTELEEPLEEYSRYAASVRAAIQMRSDKKAAYGTALADLDNKQNIVKRSAGSADLPVKQEAADKAQAAVTSTQQDFEKATDRLLFEYENFKRTKAVDMRAIIMKFVQLQIDFNRQAEACWRDLIPILDQIAVQDASAMSHLPAYLQGAAPGVEIGGDQWTDRDSAIPESTGPKSAAPNTASAGMDSASV